MLRRNAFATITTTSVAAASTSSFFRTTLRRNSTSTRTGGFNAGSVSSSSVHQQQQAQQHPQYSEAEITELVRAIEQDPNVGVRIVASMSPAARRQLVVAGSAFEWFGGSGAGSSPSGAAQLEVSAADVDKDRVISAKDFDSWFEQAMARRQREAKRREADAAAASAMAAAKSGAGSRESAEAAAAAAAAATASAAESDAAKSGSGGGVAKTLSYGCLVLIGLEVGLPFVGFGFLDNAAMILSGDAIDRTVGYYLGCSVMASAAMGNIVSGMLGMQIHGSIERLVHFFNLPVPVLSDEQRKSRPVFVAGHLGGTIGICIGLTLGMMPLFFLSDSERKGEERAFADIDINKDGKLVTSELEKALVTAGIDYQFTDEMALKIVHKYGDGQSLNHTQFHQLCLDLRAQGPGVIAMQKVL